jgi:hypothetical protein
MKAWKRPVAWGVLTWLTVKNGIVRLTKAIAVPEESEKRFTPQEERNQVCYKRAKPCAARAG